MSSRAATFHETECLGPYMFYDVIDGQESHGKNSGSLSLYNECEADAAVEVLKFFKKRYAFSVLNSSTQYIILFCVECLVLLHRYPSEFVGGRIGVITPYKSQLSVLRSRFSSAFGSSISAGMEFNTVDGFQGREVDILVLSTVRAAEHHAPRLNSSSIGFVADVRRMNVALTRAKFSLWITGNARTLQTDENWASLLKDAKERNLVRQVRRPYNNCIFKSASHEISSVEGPGNHLRQVQHVEKVKVVGKHADLQKKNTTDTSEKKRKYITSEAPVTSVTGNIEHDVPSVKAIVKESKRRVMNKHNFPLMKDVAPVFVQNSDSQMSKNLKSSVRENQVRNERTSGESAIGMNFESRELDVDNGNTDGNLSNVPEHLEKVEGKNHKHLKHLVSRRCLESSKHRKSSLIMDTGLASSEGSLKMTDRRDLNKASVQVELPNDTVMKRKQQRDAVDALLSSALVSSKKPESSAKSLPVRTLSTTSVEGRVIRPPKLRKGKDIVNRLIEFVLY